MPFIRAEHHAAIAGKSSRLARFAVGRTRFQPVRYAKLLRMFGDCIAGRFRRQAHLPQIERRTPSPRRTRDESPARRPRDERWRVCEVPEYARERLCLKIEKLQFAPARTSRTQQVSPVG